MQLKSFGCSFIFGSELADTSPDNPWPCFSKLTWPAHLANYLNYEYHSYARPGAGNLQIAERVLNQLARNENSLYVIGWTWVDRFDYSKATDWQEDRWATLMPTDESDGAKTYYKYLHSEYRDKVATLMSIRVVIDTLKQKGYPFLMTYMDNIMFDQKYHTTPAVVDLQEYIKPHMTKFKNQTFLEWSRSAGYPETKSWHPLEAAHQAAADYIIKVFDKQNIIDRKHPF